MAYEIEKVSEGNVDTPLTNFPVGIDTFPRMSDVSLTTLPLVLQYNTLYQSGNLASANQLVLDNPSLAYCMFTAKGQNELRDAVIAIEYYLLNQVDDLYNTVAQNAVGVSDNPTEEQMSVVAYSAEKVNSLIESLSTLLSGNIESLNTFLSERIQSLSTLLSEHTSDSNNPHIVTKEQVGLGNVDNTSDAEKNVNYAESAAKLKTARTIRTNLAGTSAVNFDGTANVTPGVTGVLGVSNGGTGNSSVDETPTSGSTKMVTSGGVYTALSGKQASITGGASTIASSNLTASRALISNASGKVAVSAVTSTELGYLDGVTSSIQTQLNAKAASSHNQAASTITAGTLGGKVVANAAVATLTDKQVRNIYAGTSNMTASKTALTSGDIYVMYS